MARLSGAEPARVDPDGDHRLHRHRHRRLRRSVRRSLELGRLTLPESGTVSGQDQIQVVLF